MGCPRPRWPGTSVWRSHRACRPDGSRTGRRRGPFPWCDGGNVRAARRTLRIRVGRAGEYASQRSGGGVRRGRPRAHDRSARRTAFGDHAARRIAGVACRHRSRRQNLGDRRNRHRSDAAQRSGCQAPRTGWQSGDARYRPPRRRSHRSERRSREYHGHDERVAGAGDAPHRDSLRRPAPGRRFLGLVPRGGGGSGADSSLAVLAPFRRRTRSGGRGDRRGGPALGCDPRPSRKSGGESRCRDRYL